VNEQLLAKAARSIALLIAVFAVIDPALTSERASRPDIAVLSSSTADSGLARQVAARLAGSFTVLRVPFAGAAATVIVGASVPIDAANLSGVAFGVRPNRLGPLITLAAVDVPAMAAVDARVAVATHLQVRGGRNRQFEVSLLANGNVVDRVTRRVEVDTQHIDLPLSFVPTATGAVTLRVDAQFVGTTNRVSVDAVVDVREQRWAVLFFDPRPSWMSTFVRRAVERDARFAVTSRVVTSSAISRDAGNPPASLYDPALMELYDAIVVGAPESLGERDVQGLERFLRRRGGSVVLLFDGNRRGTYERLVPVGAFANTSHSAGTVIAGAATDSVAMRATEWMWPAQLPAGAEVLAFSDAHSPAAGTRHPLVWFMSAGAGRVVISGALDSWKFRDPAQSGFETFWQQTIALAAQSSASAIELRVPRSTVRPGETVPVRLTSRVAALMELTAVGAVRSTASAYLEAPAGRSMFRVWPTATPGAFTGTLNAPMQPGLYRITASADGATVTAPLVVSAGSQSPGIGDADVLAAWVAANGGQVVSAEQLPELERLVRSAVKPVKRRVVWHPMRSAWWLVPFALGLASEWWVRRRRGRA